MESLQELPIVTGSLSELLMVKDEVQSSCMFRVDDSEINSSTELAAEGVSETVQLKIVMSGKAPLISGAVWSSTHV